MRVLNNTLGSKSGSNNLVVIHNQQIVAYINIPCNLSLKCPEKATFDDKIITSRTLITLIHFHICALHFACCDAEVLVCVDQLRLSADHHMNSTKITVASKHLA